MPDPVVDWSQFDGDPEMTVHCRCGEVYRSHTKLVRAGTRLVMMTQKPCPGCGQSRDHTRMTSSDVERVTIRREEPNE